MNVTLLLDDGKFCQVIAEFLYLDDDTIRGGYNCYREIDWEALALDGSKGGQSRMTLAQEAALCAWLEGRFCELLSSLVFEGFGSCGDLAGVDGFNSVFECGACDDFGEVVKAA